MQGYVYIHASNVNNKSIDLGMVNAVMKINRKLPVKRTTLLLIGTVLLWCTVALWNELARDQSPPDNRPHSTTAVPASEAPKQAHAAR